MYKSKALALVAAGIGLLAGCAAKGPDTAAIAAMMHAHTTAWVDAYNAGDADKIVAGYTEDAVLMPPEAPAATGHEAMKQYLVGDMASAKTAGSTLALDTDASGVSGDLAWHSGTFHVNGSGGASVATGKYLEVWHQDEEHNWLMIRDIWNTDAPAVAGAAAARGRKASGTEAGAEEEAQEEITRSCQRRWAYPPALARQRMRLPALGRGRLESASRRGRLFAPRNAFETFLLQQ